MSGKRIVIGCLLLWATTFAQAKLAVVATTSDFGALAEAIGGDNISVIVLAKPTEDPHFVDAKPSHLVKLNRADVLIENGAELEIGWLPPLIKRARNKDLMIGEKGHLEASQGIQLRDIPEHFDRSHGDIHSKGNPHYLMDPENARIVTRQITGMFCHLDEKACPEYRANLTRFESELDARLQEWHRKLAPFKGRQLVTYHNTWRYLTARFGMQADLFLEPKPGIPPSGPHLAAVMKSMKADDLRVILVEPFQSKKTARTVAEKTRAQVVEVCQFPGGLPGTDHDYFALMDANINALARALTATASDQ
jgi:zinc/manganese transport system substrate-binding protein